jgi:hypothetical protein
LLAERGGPVIGVILLEASRMQQPNPRLGMIFAALAAVDDGAPFR